MSKITLTHREKVLARHALGLPNPGNQSYRNRFIASACPGDYDRWVDMLDKGAAEATPFLRGGCRRFWLTEGGALAALEDGERLCPEDFP